MKLFIDNAFPPESNIFPSHISMRIYGGTGLEFNDVDRAAKKAFECIIMFYGEMRALSDEYEIAMMCQRIADLKEERMAYLEYCWLHCRYRRS